MQPMENENLYINVKNKICDLIYEGVYQEGDKIPPERILAEQLQVSRVTIRKALALLEADQLIIREVGSGTRVCFRNYGNQSNLDTLVLIAPAKNPFFSKFIEHFQQYADTQDALVLYIEKPQKETIENCLYRLYRKNLRNVVIWLDDMRVELVKLRRLRALGMNMVFFDTDAGVPYGDCVYLDNQKAMNGLCRVMRERGCQTLGYIGWDNKEIYSVQNREDNFLKAEAQGRVLYAIAWKKRKELEILLDKFLNEHQQVLPQAIVCGDGENGIAVAKGLQKLGLDRICVAAVDEFAESNKYGITTCCQNFDSIVKQVYQCLAKQNILHERWRAKCYAVEGIITIR